MNNKIRFWRVERSLSQMELACASGVPRWTIQLIEEGIRQPTPEEQKALSIALGIKLEDVLGNTNLNQRHG